MYVFYGVLYEHFPPEREDIYSIQILLISYQNTHCHSHEGSNIKLNPVVDDDLQVYFNQIILPHCVLFGQL
jgi:hypothetical protein